MLTEGKSYTFKILRIVEMPPEGEAFFVLEHEGGDKYLMTKRFYRHYNLVPGQNIICRVDKINCSGKIYLEPEHPGCKIGDLIEFNVHGKKEIVNSFDEAETLLLITDPWGELTYININVYPQLAEEKSIRCRVERIKKGMLLVSHPSINQPGELPDGNGPNEFIVTGMITLAENLEFFVLDLDGARHFLRYKFFSGYGFNKGSRIDCRILGKPRLFEHYLEPVNPYYEPDREYWFEFINTEFVTTAEGEKVIHLVFRDLLGHEYGIPFKGELPRWPSRVRALVKEIRMSKLITEFVTVE